MRFDPDAFLAETAAPVKDNAFDPDAFLAETAAPVKDNAFDPDAFLAETAAPVKDNAFDPDAFLAETASPGSPKATGGDRQQALAARQKELGRDLTDTEYTSFMAKIAQDEAAARGDMKGAIKLSQSRADAENAVRDLDTSKADVAAVRAPYLAVRGTLGGVTLGASDLVLRQTEKRAIGEPLQAETLAESAGENIGRLLGSIFTGARIAGGGSKINTTGRLVKASELSGGLASLIAKTGARPIAQLVATRAATSLATMAPQEAASVLNGDKPIPDAVRDTAINALSSVIGIGPEVFVRPGVANFLAQVTGQVAVDAAADAMLTGRLTRENAGEWMINELPNIATAAIFGAKDLTDKDFAAHQGKYRKDLVDLFSKKVKAQAAKPVTEYGPDVEMEGAAAALRAQEAQTVKDNYPMDSVEEVNRAITDLNLKPELENLKVEMETIAAELRTGERVAGRVPVKDDRGSIIGWKNSGAAYPGGLGADAIPALRNYLEGKPLTPAQEKQLAAAAKYAAEKLSAEAGFDVANQAPLANEDLAIGDQLSMRGEKFTVKELDPDTGNLTLKDGKLVTLKAGETVLADRGSHVDADGKPAGQREADQTDTPFDPDAFLADEPAPADMTRPVQLEPVRQQIGDITAEKTPEGNWEILGADGQRTRLDPTMAEDYALIQQIDPDARASEVKRIATETAEKLPGAKINFVDDEAQMGEIRAKYGDSVKDILAEDGSVRGFAVVGSNEYFIMTRNMRPDQAARTVLHEAVGHIGVRGVLGDRVDTVMDGIFSARSEHSATIKRIADRYELDLTTPEGRREATEELLAHVAERRIKDPGAWRRLVARIKDTFRQMGFEWAKDWTDNDVLALIQRGKERVSRPAKAATSDNSTAMRLSKNPLKTSDGTHTVSRMSETGADARNKGLPQSKPGESGNQYEKYDHQPNPDGAMVFDITANKLIPKDFYDHPEWYGDITSPAGRESWNVIKLIRGNPEAVVTIYRAVPKNTQTEIYADQWVSLSKIYAKEHARVRSGVVISKKVKAKDVRWDGNDLNEFGYQPASSSFNASRSNDGTQNIRLKQSSDLTKADQDMLNKRLKERLYGRPDLSQVTFSQKTRSLVANVDQARNEAGEPAPQTFKNWKGEADTRMQKDTTGEWLNFLSGKLHYEGDDAGQNVMVARKLLENKGLEAFASGDDAEIAKVGAAIWGYRNTRSNLARALAAGRDFLETPAERNRRWIAEALYYPGAKVDNKLKGMDLKSMQAELQKRAGKMQEIRTKLLDMGIDLAKLDEKTLNDPAQMAEIVRQIQISNAGYGDMAYEYWRNAILSAPPTHAANILGNTLSTAWNYTAQKGTEALINAMVGRKSGTTFKELPGMYRAMWGARQQAARNALMAFSTEQGSIEGIRLDDKGVAIPGKAGRVIRIPQRSLLAADEFSKSMIIQAELYSRAYQEAYAKGWRGADLDKRITQIIADPKSDMMADAIDEAKRLTFQAEPGEIANIFLKMRSLANSDHIFVKAFGWGVRYNLPFVTTPSAIFNMGLRKSPLGIFRMAAQTLMGKYSGKENKNNLVRDAAEQVLAIAGIFALISMINDEDEYGNPRITGSGPSGGKEPGKQQSEQRQYPSQSIRLGKSWYSYSRIEPLATAITHTIDTIQTIKNKPGEDIEDQVGRLISSAKSLVRDKPLLSTVGDIIRAIETDSKGLSYLQNAAASWMPNIVRSAARATDPFYRLSKVMTRDDKTLAGELASNIKQAVTPIAALQDAPKMDYWGRPLVKSEKFGYATDIIWRLVSPITMQHAHAPDNFDRMLFNYNRKAEQKGWEKFWPAMPGNAFELPGARGIERTARMNPDEYSRFLKRRGDFFFTLAAGTYWNFDDPNTMDVALFKKFMAQATMLAKNDIMQDRKLNPVLKALKQTKEDQRPRPIIKPIPNRPMMNLDTDRRSP